MNRQNERKLADRFPAFWHKLYGKHEETCMAYGFTCGDGWFPLIWNLCLAIEEELKRNPTEGFIVKQVKEKFETLRFYVDNSSDAIDSLIAKAEEDSWTTCEVCGAKTDTAPAPDSCVLVRCKDHRDNLQIIRNSGLKEFTGAYEQVLSRHDSLFRRLSQ